MADNDSLIHFWSDHETTVDLVGFSHLVDGLVGLISADHLLPATVGVYGDWGSGKSSLLKMAADKLSAVDKSLVISFNGWLFEGYDDATSALMDVIVDELQKRATLTAKGKKIAVRLLRRINWLRMTGKTLKYGAAMAAGGPPLVAMLAGLDMPEVIKKVSEGIETLGDNEAAKALEDARSAPMQTVRQFRAEFAQLIEETGLDRVVVIIDDLDRCLPDTIIETLEAIKLFLFEGKAAFVLGADERLIKYAVRARFPELPGDRTEVGQDYLEKLIQFPIRVPQMSASEMESYISLLFVDACNAGVNDASKWVEDAQNALHGKAFDYNAAKTVLKHVSKELQVGLALASHIGRVLALGLNGNPRQCKRFLNMLMMRLKMAKARGLVLMTPVLAKLMLLEYFRPESFRVIAELQAGQQGIPKELHRLEVGNEDGDSEQEGKAQKTGKQLKQVSQATPLPPKLMGWQDDSFLSQWLSMDPKLGGIDLRPYFYFSRDSLSSSGTTVVRLSGPAQELLTKLVSESEAMRKGAAADAKDMSEVDCAAVFEELAARSRRHDNLANENSPLSAVITLVGVRPTLGGQLILLLGSLPEPTVPFALVPRIVMAARGSDAEPQLRALLATWSASNANPQLQTIAQRTLQRLNKGEN